MAKSFDLTTNGGVRAATGAMKIAVPWLLLGPVGALIRLAWSRMPVSRERQVETAQKLLEAGREQNVKRMKIKLSSEAAAEVGGGIKGWAVKVSGRVGDTVEVEAEYK